jgi:hypothetical protein
MRRGRNVATIGKINAHKILTGTPQKKKLLEEI